MKNTNNDEMVDLIRDKTGGVFLKLNAKDLTDISQNINVDTIYTQCLQEIWNKTYSDNQHLSCFKI